MKKFALGILSVLMIIGGLLLTSCNTKVSLTVSEEEVSLYTNYASEPSSKEISVSVSGSSAGVIVDVLSGEGDVITVSPEKERRPGNYVFTINAEGAGDAQIRVFAKDDTNQNRLINVHVYTVLENIKGNSEDTTDARSNLYVVKGVEKKLNVEEYFELYPSTANVKDIVWSFDNTTSENPQEFVRGGVLYATIKNDVLWVSEALSDSYITLRASFVNDTSITDTVNLEVLENSTVNSLSIDGKMIYENNLPSTLERTFKLIRNNSDHSSVQGTIVVNTPYQVNLTPLVFEKQNDGSLKQLTRDEYEDLIYLDINAPIVDEPAKKITYNFTIDAIDQSSVNRFGTLYFYFQVNYKEYNFGFNTKDVDVIFETCYSATGIEVLNQNNLLLNNGTIDVFSSYETGNGYQIKANILPSDVAIDNDYYYIAIDLNQESLMDLALSSTNPLSDLVKIFYRGQELTFSNQNGSSTYTSDMILNGYDIYVASSDKFDVVENVEVSFIPVSNAQAGTTLNVNFYRIVEDDNLNITNEVDEDIEQITYISSSTGAVKKHDFIVKVHGISTISGLELKHEDNSNFSFSSLDLLTASSNHNNLYVVVRFSITLNGSNFDSQTSFWFEHVTGKISSAFGVRAFVPLTDASVTNGDKSSSDVYLDEQAVQDFVDVAGMIENNASTQTSSLSKLMLEAGVSLPINLNYQNASLSENGISFMFLSLEDLVASIMAVQGIDEEPAKLLAEQYFADASLDEIAKYYRYFEDNDGLYLTINSTMLSLTDNEFRGFVAVKFSGFDENHQEIVLVRFFAIESFYSIRYLSPSVTTALLYTSETLSQADMGLSTVDVVVSMRPDEKVPTYSNDISSFEFISQIDNNFESTNDGTYLLNDYYEISNIAFTALGRYLRFRITANSTKLQTVVLDTLSIVYHDDNGRERRTEIQIEIRNEVRVEKIEWLNKTQDGEIYLNLTSSDEREKRFTIATSVLPSDANDLGLTYKYFATVGLSTDLSILTSSSGQNFNLSINTISGGYGNLYLLPNDMIKVVDGVDQVLVYHYMSDGEKIIETPVYLRLSEFDSYYEDLLNGSETISNYFLNNDGEKIYYKDLIVKIHITIADGLSEGTAIRVYSQADLEMVDTAKFYRIMNDITLNNWKGYSTFSGMLFAQNGDVVTLTYNASSSAFIKNLTQNGVLKNLTFAGVVSNNFGMTTPLGNTAGGFVVDVNSGTIENVVIDVYYSNGKYLSSDLSSTASYVGGIVGFNSGLIKDSYAYGLTISQSQGASYVGGIAGYNSNRVENCGVEFYTFMDDTAYSNMIRSTGAVGGIVGFAGPASVIDGSYAYAYSLIDNDFEIFENGNAAKGAILAGFGSGTAPVVNETFAFLGDLKTPVVSDSGNTINFKNSYLTYKNGGQMGMTLFKNAIFSYTNGIYNTTDRSQIVELDSYDIPTDYENPTGEWANVISQLDSSVWKLTDIDAEINFGFMYLLNNNQSVAVDIADVEIADNVSPIKSLRASENKGILFVYKPLATITNAAELSELNSYNTLSVAQLFGVSEEQARSLLVTSDSKNISINSSSIKILSKNTNGFVVNVHSKMDYTQSKSFTFIILNYLPELTTTLDGSSLNDDQTILLQTNQSRMLMFDLNNTIYLNGNSYATESNTYSVRYTMENSVATDTENYLSIRSSDKSLVFTGIKSHVEDQKTNIHSYIQIDEIAYDNDFNLAIENQRQRNFGISVYEGATGIVVNNANNLIVQPSQAAVFDVSVQTDNNNENLNVVLYNDEIQAQIVSKSDDYIQFAVDSKLTLVVSWTKTQTDLGFDFRVRVNVADESKHLVEKNYDNLSIVVMPTSQMNDENYYRTVGFAVKTQEIDGYSLAVYNIETRQIRNSVLYLLPADQITNTLSPSSDAIMIVTVDPAYALMTHFTLTYETIGTGNVGTISISKLNKSNFGYYVNSTSTSLVENGIRVNLTESDKKGEGIFYFRIYVSSAFTSNSVVRFTLSYFNNSTLLKTGTLSVNVDYLKDANVLVNGSSTFLLAKGGTATVTVTVENNQELYDLSLQNNSEGISLYGITMEDFGTYKIYSASLSASVTATLTGGKTSGLFYVVATVRRVLNNKEEIKTSRATICLVDFSIDANNIKVASTGGTSTYNGKTYDVLYSYVNSTDVLRFDYPFMPESYDYDPNNSIEVSAIEQIMKSRAEFENSNSYRDDSTGYYINYQYNSLTGTYEEIAFKNQLWYATSEGNVTSIANNSNIVQNDIFTFSEEDGQLSITGRRAGRQLMMLRTTILYQGEEMVRDYYFLIVVNIWSDENTPTQIFTGDEFVDYATQSELADDYILMNDIVLNNYTPVSTSLFDSLDGNGYTIHINSFNYPTGNTLNLALFDTVEQNTTLKNVRVNIYNGGQFKVNIAQYSTVNIAGFALTNRGIIYNCEVLAYYDADYQTSTISGDVGLVVKYVNGTNTDPIELTDAMRITTSVSGFVRTNNASITNSRVGGESYREIIDIAGTNYLRTNSLGLFVIEGQGEVAGFVNENSADGYISASFVDNVQIYNNMESTTSITAGFALHNFNNIQNSYVEGKGETYDESLNPVIYNNLSNIKSIGIIAGFVYENDALIKNSYANIAIENSESKPAMAAGFVYMNNSGAEITLCYAACDIAKTDVSQMQFSGVDEWMNSLNEGTISLSYFYNETLIDDTNQNVVTSGALSVNNVMDQDTFYGFSFASGIEAYDGIWSVSETEKLTLVSANKIAFSNRYAVTSGSITSVFYNKTLIDAETMSVVDLSYGSENNPIIIRDAYDFAVSTGNSNVNALSSYKEYYSETEVFGNYRIVNNIDMSEIDQNSENDNSIKLETTSKTLSGLIDGNGFTISNINLGSSEVMENYGLFAKMNGAVVMNLDLVVDSIHNVQANIVGTLAGTVVDSRILAISLSPVSTGESEITSILGNNVVGGVVGMVFGESELIDIDVVDIDVYSSYNPVGETINDNQAYVGTTLRSSASTGNSLKTNVSKISYAGAIAGYVDIYKGIYDESVYFDSSLDISDYDILMVHVSDAVDIYGAVAGGLFGYVGQSTLIYDATLKLDADMGLNNPSYIIAKNFFAGGLIGENYGGLFAVSASYSDDLQLAIEVSGTGGQGQNNEYNYYNGDTSVERGQQSIFSYTLNDEDERTKTDDPMFIGGLVGYMGGGYIYVGYNKLNVNAHSSKTQAVGGIIGIAGYQNSQYELSFADPAPKINILLNDVYASGDVYVDGGNGVASGIIGAIENKTESSASNTTVVAMKNVLAVNYYSYEGEKLTGDRASALPDYVSDNHYMLVGEIFNSATNSVDQKLNGNLYVLDSDNNYANVKESYTFVGAQQSLTVGGYRYVQLGGTGNRFEISPYGFETDDEDASHTSYDSLLIVDPIGDPDVASMSAAYARYYTYFLSNGWDEEYWKHNEDELFPHIELLPTLDVVFWDNYNTEDVLKAMQNSGVTVVLRGRTEQDSYEYKDIDLRGFKFSDGQAFNGISNFSGTLISYYDFINSSTEGFVTIETRRQDGENPIGGLSASGTNVADKVGIIIDNTLFNNLQEGASIEGINFYLNAKDTSNITYPVVSGEVSQILFRDVTVVLNDNVVLTTKEQDVNVYSVGLISSTSYSTSYLNTTIKFRNNVEITLVHQEENDESVDVYMGLLAGEIVQNAQFTQLNIQGISIKSQFCDENFVPTVNFIIENKNAESIKADLYAGLYAGRVYKEKGSKIYVGLSDIGIAELKFKIDVDTYGEESGNVYIGGFVGEINGVDNVSMINENVSSRTTSKVDIIQQSTVRNLRAGLGFGQIFNSTLQISNVGNNISLNGGIYQDGEQTTEAAYLGGIAGYNNSRTSVQSLNVDFSVGRIDENAQLDQEIFSENKIDISVSPYLSLGTVNNNLTGDNIGGYFGYVIGAETSVSGYAQISGTVDFSSKGNVNLGGIIGQTTGGVVSSLNAENTLNISITEYNVSSDNLNDSSTAYVGGMIGLLSDQNSVSSVAIDPSNNYSYNGVLVSSAKNLVFGGAIGRIERTDFTNEDRSISISKVVYGGAVKIYGNETTMPNDIVVGGVVGEFNLGTQLVDETSSYAYSISKCVSYGDVFVNYDDNGRLDSYNVGGIVGSGAYISVSDCYSLLTSFNEKLSSDYSEEQQTVVSNVNAIVGRNSSIVKYSGNAYNSGVCLSYQEESGNSDIMYGNAMIYSGYTNIINTDESVSGISTQENILLRLSEFGLASNNFEVGHKLNPYLWNNDENRKLVNNENEEGLFVKGNSHGIKWVALTRDITKSETGAIADSLTNYAFVGNGHTITISPEEDINKQGRFGGLVNKLSGDKNKYNILSGFILNLDITTMDIRSPNIVSTGTEISYFGGLVGETSVNSYIYGVGVKGTLSVGGYTIGDGKGNSLNLAGMVGLMNGGYINECYVDADITYRAGENGGLYAIANASNGNRKVIKSTYSSGLLETYIDVPVYKFARVAVDDTTNSGDLDVVDSYTISQVKQNNVLGNTFENTTSDLTTNNGVLRNFIIGDNSDNSSISLSYSEKDDRKIASLNCENLDSDENATEHTWYFSRFVNYGYASHGFGYLKNVTTYVSVEQTSEEVEAFSNMTNYEPLSYQSIITQDNLQDYYFGVLNQWKFKQMIETSQYQYLLRYDFELNPSITAQDVGTEDGNERFVLDGNERTVTLLGEGDENTTKSLFGEVYGDIKNLRIDGININEENPSNDIIGGLAAKVNGNVENITANGSINISSKKSITVGGVVGQLKGEAKDVDSTVYVNVKSSIEVVAGGIVGTFEGTFEEKIDSSSNSGQIIAITSSANKTIYVGGIAGKVSQGSVINSYNANSVLGNYTNNLKSGTNYAGGIVGYSENLTISNCYNVGLVASGNTKGGISYAGGIVGYGANTSMLNCINDGSVQAVGDFPDTKYKISATVESGEETTAGYDDPNKASLYKSTPGSLEYEVTIVYNPDQDRKVFAFGLGWLDSSSTIEGSVTSTNNIKNEGNIGEVTMTDTLTFDRTSILDNFVGESDYRGKFSSDGTTYVNALDSYGYASRIYMTDIVKRGYFGWGNLTENTDYYNEIHYALRNQLDADNVYEHLRIHDNLYYYGSYDVKETIDEKKINYYASEHNYLEIPNEKVSAITEDDIIMSAETTYYESLDFVRYDELLVGNCTFMGTQISSVVGIAREKFVQNETTYGGEACETNEEISDLVDSLIAQDKNEERQMEAFTINGKNAAQVYNANNIKVLYGPYEYAVKLNLSLDNVEESSISSKNFVLEGVTVQEGEGETSISPQFYEIYIGDITQSENSTTYNVEIDLKIYFDQNVDNKEIGYSISYLTSPYIIELGKNNVIKDDQTTTIILQDDDGDSSLNPTILESVNNGGRVDDEAIWYSMSVFVGGNKITDYGIAYNAYKGYYYITFDNNYQISNNQKLELNIYQHSLKYSNIEGSIVTTKNAETFNLKEVDSMTANRTFVGYAKASLLPNAFSFEEILSSEDNSVTGIKVLLSSIVKDVYNENIKRFAFGASDNSVNVHFENGTYSCEDLGLDGWAFRVDNQYLYIYRANVVDGTEVQVSKASDHDKAEEGFDSVLQKFSLIYYDLPSTEIFVEIVSGVASESKIGDLTFSYYLTPQKNGNFSPEGKYEGDDFNNDSTGENSIDEYFGMEFYAKNVRFSYTLGKNQGEYNKLTNEEDYGVGYEFVLYDDAGNKEFLHQGYLGPNESYQFDDDFLFNGNELKVKELGVETYNSDISVGIDIDSVLDFALENQTSLIYNKELDDGKILSVNYDEEVCPRCGQNENESENESKNERYISTSVQFNTSYTGYRYIYKIYDCGTISVEYYLENRNGSPNADKWKQSVKYVLYNELLEEGKMLKYAPSQETITIQEENKETGEEAITAETIVFNSEGETVDLDLDKFYSYTAKGAYGSGETNFDTITVDIVASYADEDKIYFSRSRAETDDKYQYSKIKFMYAVEQKEEYSSDEILLYSENKEHLSDTYSTPPDNMVEGTFEYRESFEAANGEIVWGEWQNSSKFEIYATTYTPKEFAYRYNVQSSGEISLGTNLKEGTIINYEYIILKRDINLGVLGFDKNNFTIIGNNYNLKYVGNKNTVWIWNGFPVIGESHYTGYMALFGTNNKMIKDLNVISIVSAISTPKRFMSDVYLSGGDVYLSGFIGKNSSSAVMSNIKILGTIRNINPYGYHVNSFSWGSQADTNENIKTYLTMIGLDGDEKRHSVSTVLSAGTMEKTNIVSYDILIAGNGYNGEDGQNGYDRIDYKTNRNGGNGQSGGNGGEINISANTFNGYFKVGAGGFGGNGGNGANGGAFNKNTAKKVQKGGTAGSTGSPGESGNLTKLSELNVSSNQISSTQRDDTVSPLSGNSGLGTLGRIYNGYYYFSASSDLGKGHWHRVYEINEPEYNDEGDRIHPEGWLRAESFGIMSSVPIFNGPKSMFDNQWWGGVGDIRVTVEKNYNEALESYSEQVQKLKNSEDTLYPTKVFVFAQHETSYWFGFVVWGFDNCFQLRTGWTSGEGILSEKTPDMTRVEYE